MIPRAFVGQVVNLRRIGNPPGGTWLARPQARAGSLPHRAGGLAIRRGLAIRPTRAALPFGLPDQLPVDVAGMVISLARFFQFDGGYARSLLRPALIQRVEAPLAAGA